MKRKAYLLILIIGIITCILPNNQFKTEESVTVNRIEYKENNPPTNSSNENYEIQQVKFLTVAVQVQGEFDEKLKSSPITCKCHVTRMTRLIYMDGSNELGTKSVIYKEKVGELMVPSKFGYNFVEWIDANNKVVDANSIINSAKDFPIYAHYNIIVSQLKVDPNNGTWDGGTEPKEYSMEYNQTKEIPDPTRTGYTFDGWEVTGEASTINNNEFKMGVTDTVLKAKWKANTYKININPNGGTYKGSTGIVKVDALFDHDTAIELPLRTGYTFTGWTIDHGTKVSDTVIRLNYAGDINITATWQINNYIYMARHKKQNTNGSGYFLHESDTGTAEYNSIVSPPVKSYTGFTSPTKGSIKIQVDSDPPTKNVLDYLYNRQKARLTLNLNGGSISGSTSMDLFYEQEYTLPTPTKPGYTFTGWEKDNSDSLFSGNTLTMKLQPTNITAHWRVNSYTLTYDVNGGNPVSPNSRTITFDTQYGTLPTPIKPGYRFLGWYTAKSGGTQITASTVYKTPNNSTIYAHWHNDAPTITNVSMTYAHPGNGGANGILTGGSETATISANIADVQDGTPSYIKMSCTSGTVCSNVTISQSNSGGKTTFTVRATAMGIGTLKIIARDAAGVETSHTLILYVYGAGSSLSKVGRFTDNTYDSGYTAALEGCYISHYTFDIQLYGHSNGSRTDEIKIFGITDSGTEVQLHNFKDNLGSSKVTIKDKGLDIRNNGKGNYITRIKFFASVPTSHLGCVNNSSNLVQYSIQYEFSSDLLPTS